MTKIRGSLAARLLGEFVVIVVGVMVALWAESWRQQQADVETRLELLESLAAELETNLIQLDSAILTQDQYDAARRTLLEVHSGERAEPSLDSLRALLSGAGTYWRISPSFGVYDGMVANGEARLLRNRDLAIRLARARFALQFGSPDMGLADRARDDFFAVIRRHGGFLAYLPESDRERLGGLPEPRDSPRVAALLGDPEFSDTLFFVLLAEFNVTETYRALREDLRATRQIMSEALATARD